MVQKIIIDKEVYIYNREEFLESLGLKIQKEQDFRIHQHFDYDLKEDVIEISISNKTWQ